MSPKPIQVLLVEDNLGDARLLQELLDEAAPTQFELTHVQRLAEALACLEGEAYDVVLLDLGLPDSHGVDTVVQVAAVAPSVPIVVLTGLQDEELAVRAVREGAQDYLIKGQIDGTLLARSIRYATERKWAEGALREREVETMRLAALQESRRRIVEAQEELRKEIAGELHGPVQTRLLMLQRQLEQVAKGLNGSPGDGEQTLAEIARQVDDIRENQIRRISHRLHPSIISVGLAAGLRSLRDDVERAIPIELEIGPEVAEMEAAGVSAIPEEVRLGLYRVAEEAMSNVVKHAKATRAVIRLRADTQKKTMVLSIEDDGQGFVAHGSTRGLGFTTIDDYLGAIGGTYVLETAPGQGTRITATIPLDQRTAPEDGTS